MRRMKHYDRTAADIYKLLDGPERGETLNLLTEMLRLDQKIRSRLFAAKKKQKGDVQWNGLKNVYRTT
jgi:hypothetical protein